MGKKKNFSCEEPSEASIADSIYLQRKAEEDYNLALKDLGESRTAEGTAESAQARES